MGFFDKIFNAKKKIVSKDVSQNEVKAEKCQELLQLKVGIDALLENNEFIAKSEYTSLIPKYSQTIA